MASWTDEETLKLIDTAQSIAVFFVVCVVKLFFYELSVPRFRHPQLADGVQAEHSRSRLWTPFLLKDRVGNVHAAQGNAHI